MFEIGKKKSPAINTILGERTTVTGDLVLEGDIIIYGQLNGNLRTDGTVTVFSSATIKGNIEAAQVNIGGHVEGNVNAQGRVALGDKAYLIGDIKATQIVIEDGAIFEGRCEMHFPPAHVPLAASTDETAGKNENQTAN